MWTLYDFIASGFLVAVALAGLGMLTLVFVERYPKKHNAA